MMNLRTSNPLNVLRLLAVARAYFTIITLLFGLQPLMAQSPPVANPLVWLKADASVALIDTNVVSWTNQVANGVVFTAPTVPARPTLATNVVNGLPAIRFDGSRRLTGNLGRVLTNATIFTLCQFNITNSDNDYVYTLGTPSGSGSQMTLSRRDGDNAYHYDGSIENSPETTIPPFAFQVFTQVYGEDGSTNHQLYQNLFEMIDSHANNPYSVNASNTVLGNWSSSSFYFVGDMVEWLVYDRVLNFDERRQVAEYLRQRAALSQFFAPGSLDLSDWNVIQYEVNAQPDAQWVLRLANRAIDQLINSDPSIYLSPFAIGDQTIRARMGSGDAPDTMGFVFGYQDRGHYYLFDWKKTTDSYQSFGTQPAGMRLRKFHVPGGLDPNGADFWSGLNVTNTTKLQTNNIPWVDGVDYDLVIQLRSGQIKLDVFQGTNTLASWTVNDTTYPSGRFGYYVNSLQFVRFGQIVLDSIQPLITNIQIQNGTNSSLTWINGLPPFQIQSRTNLALGDWVDAGDETTSQQQTVVSPAEASFFRVRGADVPP
ncbi:MAG: hypothetical protein WDM80_02885 [Limisphaerales bacterium]